MDGNAVKVFFNGRILTLDSVNTEVNAMAIKNERLIALGTDKEILSAFNSCAKHDLNGQVVIPGFYDDHGHFGNYCEYKAQFVNINMPPIGDCNSISDCLDKLKKRAENTPVNGWVLGYGFDDTLVKEKRFPTKEELDTVSTKHHVAIMHISIRFCAVNTKVIDFIKVNENTPNPPAGLIWKTSEGKLYGVFEGNAVPLVTNHFPQASIEKYVDAYTELGKEYSSKGITSAIDAGVVLPHQILAFLRAEAQHKIFTRFSYNSSPFRNGDMAYEHYESHLLKHLKGRKYWLDGSLQGFTGFLTKPYHTPYKGDPEWKGYPTMDRETVFKYVLRDHMEGYQLVLHVNGDASIDMALNAIEYVLEHDSRSNNRFLLIHAQTIREDQLERCRKLGVTISFFTIHTFYWGDRHKHIFLGPDRAERQNPMRDAIDKGIIVTSHCDVPIVPVDPLFSMWACVNRISSNGDVIGASQKITPLEALRAHTYNPAWQNFEEQDKGSLEAGKFADFVVLDRDPLTCDPMSIKDIQVLKTFIGGKQVYQKDQ